jgi:hypothetical protein
METIKTPHPALVVSFIEAVFDCTDAAFVYHKDGKEVGQVQLCGSSDGRTYGYAVTVEVPNEENTFWCNYEVKTKKLAEAQMLQRLAIYGII